MGKVIPVGSLVFETPWQIPGRVDSHVVENYAECYRRGEKFPLPIVVKSGDKYLVVTGEHRARAQILNGCTEIAVDPKTLTPDEAAQLAWNDNAKHGLPLSRQDKIGIRSLALKRWPDLSSRDIAERTGLSHTFIEDGRTPKPAPKKPVEPTPPSSDEPDEPGDESEPTEPTDEETDDMAAVQAEFDELGDALRETTTKIAYVVAHLQAHAEHSNYACLSKFPESYLLEAVSKINLALQEIEGAAPGEWCDRCGGEGCNHCGDRGWYPRRKA